MSRGARHCPVRTVHLPWSDDEMLQALALRDEGLTLAQIGERMGRGRSAVGGVLGRIDRELHDSEHGDGRRP
jgi:hypothetical protein